MYHGRKLQSFSQRGKCKRDHKRSIILSYWAGRVYFYAKGAAYIASKDASTRPQLCINVTDQGGGAAQRFLVGEPLPCTSTAPPLSVLEKSARGERKASEFQEFPWDLALQDIAQVPPL